MSESSNPVTEPAGVAARKTRSLSKPSSSNPRSRSPIFRKPFEYGSDMSLSSRETSVSRASSTSRDTTPVGLGTGIAKARADLKKAKEDATEDLFNQRLRDRIFRKDAEFILDPEEGCEIEESPAAKDPSSLNAEELRAAAGQKVAAIINVATKSKNLKGGFTKCLKESASALQEFVDVLVNRTESEETRKLRLDNARLRKEVSHLKMELRAHRREFVEMKSSMAANNVNPGTLPSFSADFMEELKGSIIASVGSMIDAKLAGIEGRLLPERVSRPPLASDSKSQKVPTLKPGAVTSKVQSPPGAEEREETNASTGVPEAVSRPSQSHTKPKDGWSAVVKRGKKSSKSSQPLANAVPATPAAVTSKSRGPPSLVSPKTTAVIITLEQEAISKGITYAQVLEEAEQKINLQELGVGEGIRIRRAATGARLLELPEEQTSEQAELLINRLREVLKGMASVVRPMKLASLRVMDLDDSVTKEKVAGAIARVGKCMIQSVKVGDIVSGPRGMGATTVQCPMDVAKTLSEAGKLLVGWSSARVHVLDQRPLRCFRCLNIGHTRPVCPSPVDRSNLCFRCGSDGHKSASCSNPMQCLVCVAAGRPAGHIMGGRSCNPPVVKGSLAAPSRERRHNEDEANMSS